MTTIVSVDDYDIMFAKMKDNLPKPWKVDTRLGTVVYYLRKQTPSGFGEAIASVHSELKCATCKKFMVEYGLLSDSDGNTPFSGADSTIYKVLADASAPAPYYDISEHAFFPVVITSSNSVFGNDGSVPFTHFHLKFQDVSNLETFGKKLTLDEINQAMTKYLPLLHNMQMTHGKPGIHASLDLCLQVLDKVTYGDRFKENTKWFRTHVVENYNTLPVQTKWNVLMKMLFDTPLSRGIKEMICTAYHQVTGNILDGLTSARDAHALERMLTARLDPSNYCRPTAIPTTNELDVAIACLKDTGFAIELMTEKDLLGRYGGIKCFTPENEERRSAVDMMQSTLNTLTLEKRSASNFAARSTNEGVLHVNTIMDVIKIAETTPVEVYGGRPICLTVYPDTAKDVVIHPHLWMFHNGSTHSDFSMDESPTSHRADNIVNCNMATSCRIYGRNVFFICKGASPKKSNIWPGYFPEFLSPAYQRKCRVAFEHLNRTSKLVYPKGSVPPYAFGIGTSAMNDSGTLCSALTFVIKGKSYIVSRLK
jgi:hypothetical protein